MSIIKKMGITIFGIITIFTLNFGYCYMDDGKIPSSRVREYTTEDPQVGPSTITSIDDGPKTFSDKLKGILQLPKPENYPTALGYILSLIKISINWLLGLLATVALVYMLYCGFLVFTSGADDKNVSKGKKGISTAAIALAGILLSWLIISVIIRFIALVSKSGN